MTAITVLTSNPKKPLTKTVSQKIDATTGEVVYSIAQYDQSIKFFSSRDEPVQNFDQLAGLLDRLIADPYSCIIRGVVREGTDRSGHVRRKAGGEAGCIEEVDQQWVAIDVDKFPLAALGVTDIYKAPEEIRKLLPTCFAKAACWWKFSSSMGFTKSNTFSGHFYFWLSAPISNAELKSYFNSFNKSFSAAYGTEDKLVDLVFFDSIQIHYTAAPVLVGVEDPLKIRCGVLPGLASVDLEDDIQPTGDLVALETKVHDKLSQVGSDKEGFHVPLRGAAMVAARIWPGANGLVQFKALARDAILRADKSQHSAEQIERYKSDYFLDQLFNSAAEKIGTDNINPNVFTALQRYVFIRTGNNYLDTISGKTVVTDALNKEFAYLFGGKRAADKIFHENKNAFREASHMEFVPGEKPKEVVSVNGVKVYNTWEGRVGSIINDEPVIQPLVDHLHYLCDGDQLVVDQLLDYMAYIIKYPGKKVMWAPVISGHEGTGKSTLKRVMSRVFKSGSIKEITVTSLESQFNPYMESELIFLEEVYASSKMEVADKLKTIITEQYIDLNKKHEQQKNIRNYANLMVFTNQTNPLYMSSSDRRYLVIRSESPKKPQEYYEKLHEWIDHEKCPDWLTTWSHLRDLSKFSPTKPPIVTAAKERVIEASRSGAEQMFVAAMRERSWPLQHDAVTLQKLKTAMRTSATLSTVKHWLKNSGVEVRMINNVEVVIVDARGRTDAEILEIAKTVVVGSEQDYHNGGMM